MKVSVYNFKSIKELTGFEIKPLTIIAGVNNSGKSSLFQWLRLIQQTISLASTAIPLAERGDFAVSGLKNLVFDRRPENQLGISFEIDIKEFSDTTFFGDFGVSPDSSDAAWILEVRFDFDEESPVISEFELLLSVSSADQSDQKKPRLSIVRKEDGYIVETNVSSFGGGLWEFSDEPKLLNRMRFESIFPLDYELAGTKLEVKSFTLPPIKEFLIEFFSNLFYIGPVRESPRDSYVINQKHRSVGIAGEYSAQILCDRQDDPIEYYKVSKAENSKRFEPAKTSLLQAVRYWICEEFEICSDIFAVEKVGVYQIFLKTPRGLTTTINHVGFGVSQLLPIVIEGLSLPNRGTIVLEEPESHLHPKLQAQLFDFLYSLVCSGKTVVIETHSDHFVTRMRRRVAEDQSDEVAKQINFSIVTTKNGTAIFETITLDEFGVTEYFPEDFIEVSNSELAFLIEAQMDKRISRTQK